MNARGRSLAEIRDSARASIEDDEVGFVMLDSISRTGYGDLNENLNVNKIMDELNRLAPTWGALGHTPRADESHVFGGVHFDAAADVMVRLSSQRTDKELGIQLHVTKANDIKVPPPMTMALEFDNYGLLSVRKADAKEFEELAEQYMKGQPLAAQIADYLKRTGASRLEIIAEALEAKLPSVRTIVSTRGDLFVHVEKGTYGLKQVQSHFN